MDPEECAVETEVKWEVTSELDIWELNFMDCAEWLTVSWSEV